MTPVLALRGVRKSFPLGGEEVEILHDIDLAIQPGEYVAIMGASGSGKTTCLEILGTLSRPSAGTVRFEGEPIDEWSDDALADLRAARLGFVFQTFHLMPRMSALRNAALPLLYGGVARGEREDRRPGDWPGTGEPDPAGGDDVRPGLGREQAFELDRAELDQRPGRTVHLPGRP